MCHAHARNMIRHYARTLPDNMLEEMRAFVAEILHPNEDDPNGYGLSSLTIVREISRHYPGGVATFIHDNTPAHRLAI